MKEVEKEDLPEVGGGIWNDEGCTQTFPDPIIPTTNPLAPDPTAPLLLDL